MTTISSGAGQSYLPQIQKNECIRLFLATLAVAAAAINPLLCPSTAIGGPPAPKVIIHFVDTGIAAPGDTLARLLGRPLEAPVDPFGGLPGVARLSIFMPPDAKLKQETREQLQQEIATQVRDFANTNLTKGMTDLEVQFAENVSFVYFDAPPHPDPYAENSPNRQDLAGRFGIAAYGALA
jgi:hypothetical protein